MIHLAGDVVLDAPSLELTELDTPLVVTTSLATCQNDTTL